jgi:hypothetical protein
VKRVTDIMAEIAAASQEQTSGIEQVNQAIIQMDQVTQQNAALVEEAAAAAESMQEQAQGLTKAVAIFKLSATNAAGSADAAFPLRDPWIARRGSGTSATAGTRSKGNGKSFSPQSTARLQPAAAPQRKRRGLDSTTRTQQYREDHARFVALVGKISQKLDSPGATKAAAGQLADDLARLSGALKVHLNMEDRALYPALIASNEPHVQRLAQRFQAEMGNLTEQFGAYVKKWRLPAAIESDPRGFASETKHVFGALAQRIERENNELYAAADALDSATLEATPRAQPRTKVRKAVNADDENWQEF